MANTYYDSQLTASEIESALEAVDGVISPSNNGKVLAIENGKIVAKSASEFTDAPVLESLSVTANGDYTPGVGVDGYNAVHVAVPGAGTIEPLSVTQNGTYNPPSGVDGYAPVTVNVAGGSIPVIFEADWDAMTTAQKKSYGLCVIQTASSGFERGKYVNGADYVPFEVLYTGTAKNSASVSVDLIYNTKLIVIAMNSEASGYQLVTAATLDGTALSGTDISFHGYESCGQNRRNYRITAFDIAAGSHDLSISLTTNNNYSSFVYIVLTTLITTIDKELTMADAATTGTNNQNGMVIFGTFDGGTGGTIQAEIYTAGDTITTPSPGSSYKSSYIFWFV